LVILKPFLLVLLSVLCALSGESLLNREVREGREDLKRFSLALFALLAVIWLSREENVRLACARHRGNAEATTVVAEDVLLGGSRGEGVH